jgi:mannose-1-phosphate guanylyltransferase/phosphomannomutase
MRVAMAYATLLPKGATVTASRDSSRAARVLKRAVMVGLNAAGVNVEDLEVATIPVTQFQVRTGPSRGGITVRLDEDDPQSVNIRFLDPEGVDIGEDVQRKIERLYDREESRRVLAAEIGDIEFPARSVESYTAALLGGVEVGALRRDRFKLVLDYAFGAASLVMPSVLGKLNANVLVVNPLVSTVGLLGFDRTVHARHLAELVRSSGANLGAVIGPSGEQLTLIDDTGRLLSDGQTLLLLVRLFCEAYSGARIAVPVSASWQVGAQASAHGGSLIWSKLGTAPLMEVAQAERVHLASNGEGCFAIPAFLPAFDAVATLVHLLSLLAARAVPLSRLVAELPESVVVHRHTRTPFEQKGMVMRNLLEQFGDEELILIDGIKRYDEDGWTLIVPDPDEPDTHVYAEASDLASSNQLASKSIALISDILSQGH